MAVADIESMITKFSEWASSDTCLLRGLDGLRVRIPKPLLMQHSFFENLQNEHPDSTCLNVNTNWHALQTFRAFLLNENCAAITDVFELLKLACTIQSDEFARYCAQAATGIKIPHAEINASIFPLSSLMKFLPLRTYDQYVDLLPTTDNSQYKAALLEAITFVLRSKKQNIYRPLPVPVFTNRVTIALMHDSQGRRMTACLLGRKWVPIDVFGPKFRPFRADIRNFYLCFDKYVVYLDSDGCVMMKDLHSDGGSAFLAENCALFKSRFNCLHLMCEDERGDKCLYRWDHKTMSLVKRPHSIESAIYSSNIDCDGTLILELHETSLPIKYLENDDMYTVAKCTFDEFSRCAQCSKEGINEDLTYMNLNGKWTYLTSTIYKGYNVFSTECVGDGLFETTIYEKSVNNCYETVAKTQLHGKIIALSDVVLL